MRFFLSSGFIHKNLQKEKSGRLCGRNKAEKWVHEGRFAWALDDRFKGKKRKKMAG
jgi:hypothetical protein